MDAEKQIELVIAMCDNIRNHVVGQIITGRVPKEWGGHELRALLADQFERERTSLMTKGRSARVKAYRAAVYENNL